jgi:hypothetical protein
MLSPQDNEERRQVAGLIISQGAYHHFGLWKTSLLSSCCAETNSKELSMQKKALKSLSATHLKVPTHTACCQMAWTRTLKAELFYTRHLWNLDPGLCDVAASSKVIGY